MTYDEAMNALAELNVPSLNRKLAAIRAEVERLRAWQRPRARSYGETEALAERLWTGDPDWCDLSESRRRYWIDLIARLVAAMEEIP